MKNFFEVLGISKLDEEFIKNVSEHHYDINYDNLIYIVYKMGLTDKLNEEIRKAPNSFNIDEKKDFITKKALELLYDKVPQEVRNDIKTELANREARIDKYVDNKEEFITYFCLQTLLYNRFSSNNFFNRVFDNNIKNMYYSNKNKDVVISWMMCSLRDRWKKETIESSYKKKINGITFSAVSREKLDELVEYYDGVLNNKDIVANIFLKNIKSKNYNLYVTNTPLDNGCSSIKDEIVYFNQKSIKAKNTKVFFHELSHFVDDTSDNPSIKAFSNYLEIIRNDHRIDKYKDLVEKAAREDNRYEDTSEVASIYDALYKGELHSYYGFPGHGVSYFSKPGNSEKEIFAILGELVTSGREWLLLEFFPEEYADNLIKNYYNIVFNTDKYFDDKDNNILLTSDSKDIVNIINNAVNNIDIKENSSMLDDDYLALYLLQPRIIDKYFSSMRKIDNDFDNSLRSYLDSNVEIKDSNVKKYLDLMGKERSKLAIKNYLGPKKEEFTKK